MFFSWTLLVRAARLARLSSTNCTMITSLGRSMPSLSHCRLIRAEHSNPVPSPIHHWYCILDMEGAISKSIALAKWLNQTPTVGTQTALHSSSRFCVISILPRLPPYSTCLSGCSEPFGSTRIYYANSQKNVKGLQWLACTLRGHQGYDF